MSARPTPPVPKIAYSATEAAEATGVAPDTIKRAIRAGQLKAKRTAIDSKGVPAGKYLILHTDLIAWLDGLEAA